MVRLTVLSRESREKKTKCEWIAPSHPLSWPCVSDLLYLKARAGYAPAQPSMTRKPQLQSYTIRVWSYETFIVSLSSSSGYTSGQNLEVLYIIRNSI